MNATQKFKLNQARAKRLRMAAGGAVDFPWVDEGNDPVGAASEAAAQRVRQSVRPIDGRKEGAVTRGLDALGTMAYNTAAGPARLVNSQMSEYQPGMSVQDMPQTMERLPEVAMNTMGGGAPFAQAGAAGIFGGKLARTADHAALARAEEMVAKGANRDQIWNETGWFKGPDDKWRFEIPDDSLSVRKGYGAGLEFGEGEAFGRDAPKIEHPDLTEAYPRKFDYLAHNVNVARGADPSGRFMPRGPGQNEEFYYSDKPVLPSLFVKAPTTRQARDIASHELQHAVQGVEGFSSGASPQMAYDPALRARANRLFQEAQHARLSGDVERANTIDSEAYKLREASTGYDAYRRMAGEVEARNVQSRLKMTPEQRRATPPWATEDVPLDRQITNGYADGGAVSNPFDKYVTAPPTEVNPFDKYVASSTQQNAPPQTGGGEAFLQGLSKGVTANWNDELAASAQASGLSPAIPSLARSAIGAGRVGLESLLGNPGTASAEYDKTLQEARAREELLHKEHPYWMGAGELAGSVAGMAAMPGGEIAQGARFLPRIGQAIKSGAQVGAEYGALSGAGEGKDLADRASGAGVGAIAGGVGGGAGGALGEGIGALGKLGYDQFGKPLAAIYRGWKNPEEEALRRGALAIMEGQPNVRSGKSLGLTPPEWLAAKQAGEPVMLADMGGETGRALARSAANTDPEGRALITSAVQDRFAGQSDRAASDVRKLVAGGANATKTQDQLIAEYDLARVPAYSHAFSRPAAQDMWGPEFEQISQAPPVQNAIRAAWVTAKDYAARAGLTPPKIPFAQDSNGRYVLDAASGIKPTLQFWDAVKKNLDQMGPEGRFWSKTLRGELDQLVPEYGKARGVAAKFFGEDNAIEAGRKAVGQRMDPADLSKLMRSMSDPEKELFREGWASEWSKRLLDVSDRNDVTGRVFQSPNERSRANVVFGAANLGKVETRLRLEKMYDALRGALGNSTTARQLIEAGLAGGGIGAYLGNGDPKTILAGIGAGLGGGSAGVAAGMKHSLSSVATTGAHKVIGYVDRNTARRVAEFLTSDDPHELLRGLQLVQKNPRLAQGLRDITDRVSIATGSGAAPAAIPQITVHPIPKMLQSPSSVGAEENQGNIPRPPGQ